MSNRIAAKSSFLLPFMAGLAVAPFVKPFLRGAFKTAVGASLRMKALAAEAALELQGIASEATAEHAASAMATAPQTAAPRAT